MAKRKLTSAERAERDARHERMRRNSETLRDLAERGLAKLGHLELMEENILRPRRLAERGLAELRAREQAS